MRKYGILGFLVIVVVAVLGVVASLQEWWVHSLILGFVALTGVASLVLACTRYIARLLRTQERKSRMASKRAAEQFKKSVEAAERKVEDLFASQHRRIDALDTSLQSYDQSFSGLNSGIQKATRSTANHVTQSVRHSTSEVEALLQIYSRFSDLKLPMPSSGGWALDARSLAHLISIFEERRPQRILELGSGTSTVWLAYLCRQYGGKVIALDHLDQYLERTRSSLRDHGLGDYVDARLAPLERISCDGESYQWYALDALADLSDIDMVLIDGPPATTGRNARYPALPNIIQRLAQDATVVLDDAHRPDESDIVVEWQTQFPEFTRQILDTPRLAILNRNVG